MADLPLSLPLTDTISSIIDTIITDVVPGTVTAPPITVTVTADPSTSTSKSSATSSVTSHSQNSTSVSTSASSASTNISSTDPPEFVTTTYVTNSGASLLTITAIISNPSGRTHNNLAANGFMSNHTAVIGVFTAVGIIVVAIIIAIVAWVARRRTLKRWQRERAEKESFDRRNFLQDEMHDEQSPSEKSWWANASGTSIPDGTGVPLQVVYGVPPVPPLPTDRSPTTTTFAGSNGSKSVGMSSETRVTIPHPYGSPTYSILPDTYQPLSPNAQRRSVQSIISTRDAARSPPPSIPLPPLPYASRGADATHLPIIIEGPPSSTSTDGWTSQIQPALTPATSNEAPLVPTNILLRTNSTTLAFSTSAKASAHPFASPPTNRKSELYPEDVLLDLGINGGVGRSLSGSRPGLPPLPTNASSANASQDGSRAQSALSSRAQTSTGHSNVSHSAFRQASGSGLSDGGWYDESPSDKAAMGAAASGESVLGGDVARINGLDYTKQARESEVISANGLSVDIAERKRVPHDPRFSGLFGAWGEQLGDQRNNNHRQSDSMASVDMGTEDDHHGAGAYAPRVLRVTNE